MAQSVTVEQTGSSLISTLVIFNMYHLHQPCSSLFLAQNMKLSILVTSGENIAKAQHDSYLAQTNFSHAKQSQTQFSFGL